MKAWRSDISSSSGLLVKARRGDELLEDGVEGGVRASSSQESGGGAGVADGFKERDFSLEEKSARGVKKLVGCLSKVELIERQTIRNTSTCLDIGRGSSVPEAFRGLPRGMVRDVLRRVLNRMTLVLRYTT